MSTLEILTFAFGIACVWLTVKRNIWCWPTGLVMVVLYMIICWQEKLYSDLWLQVIYIFMQIYGWYFWLHGGSDHGEKPITLLSRRAIAACLTIAVSGTWLLGWFMHTRTQASVPYFDAFTTVVSLIAQWLMGRKVLESWVAWIVVDVVYIYVFLVKDLYLMLGLYAIFLFLATKGLIEWRKALKDQPACCLENSCLPIEDTSI